MAGPARIALSVLWLALVLSVCAADMRLQLCGSKNLLRQLTVVCGGRHMLRRAYKQLPDDGGEESTQPKLFKHPRDIRSHAESEQTRWLDDDDSANRVDTGDSDYYSNSDALSLFSSLKGEKDPLLWSSRNRRDVMDADKRSMSKMLMRECCVKGCWASQLRYFC